MKKIVLSGIVAIGLAIGFSGCVGAGQPQIISMQKIEKKVLTTNFSTINPVNGEKFDFNLQNYNLSSEIMGLSKYKQFHVTKVARPGISITEYAGIDVKKENTSYLVEYKNGEMNARKPYFTTSKYIINYVIDANRIIFDLKQDGVKIPFSNAIGIGIDPLDTDGNLQSDIANIYSNLDKLIITISKDYKLKGEMNTKYSDTSIYANFKRILGEYDWSNYNKKDVISTDIEKKNTFSLSFNGKNYPLKVEVYPYRDGSKVIYSTDIDYNLKSDGTASISKKDIEQLEQKISSVIND